MKKFIISLLLLLNVAIIPCYATSWVEFDDNSFIDKDSIRIYINDNGYKHYNKRVFWTKYEGDRISKDLEKAASDKVEYVLFQHIVDYSNNTIALKSGVAYDKDGKPITHFSYQDVQLEYHSIAPNSSAEIWKNLVKKPRALKKIYQWQQSQLLKNEQ